MKHVLNQALSQAIRALVPVIETERLRLRAPALEDFASYEAVFTSDRSVYIDGPYTTEEAFADFTQAVAGWMLQGMGAWTITTRGSDAALGWVYLWQEFGDPEPELGWVLTQDAEGRGIASEAARAVLPFAMDLLGSGGVVSYIDARNAASIRVAEKLGARRDPRAEASLFESGLAEPGLFVYRHFAGKERS
jgi:RimJ/RimL family protein N-acetyltransferase